ncbi:site-specific integrase [Solibacillus sp. CAU 1738]|uniref:tyrosine-type recombinase/integrase n=1 Tax=Solibacillus sp. CAU 1738 TaxID=3140363 RepID=UPI0032619524
MNNLTVYVEHFKTFLDGQSKSAHTIKQYSLDSAQFIQFVKKNKLESITAESIEQYKIQLQENYSSITTINRKLASLKSFVHFLQSRNIMKPVDDQLFLPLENSKNELNVLTNKQIRQALQIWFTVYETVDEVEVQWMALRNYTIMRIISELGIKPSEVVRMKWSHINSESIRIISKQSYRDLPVSKELLRWLDLYKLSTEEVLPIAQQIDYIWLGLGNKQGEPISVKTIERLFKHVSIMVGYKVTCTNVRYFAIQEDMQKQDNTDLDLLFEKYGYARKSVLKERALRMEGDA